MIEQTVDVPTKDGRTTTFIVHPERGGPHPIVLFFMDAPAIREELRDMARRLASVGYYVILPNLYYRRGVMELKDLPPLAEDKARERMFELMNSLSIPLVMDDAEALLDYASRDPAAGTGPVGTVGYCMSGRYAINFAARWPSRVGAAASIYGTQLVTDDADSPHLVASKASAELYFACAETDRWAPLETVEALDTALKGAGVRAEVEIYPGVEHGFAFPQRAVYDKASAERHWERLFALFKRNLS
ncbi:dienelactone hydrolase family protein [Phenylobacterium sp.]|jgi:carboxymethylenebutenolidase|uniref:dienelactone hydrolase family protein n=1 Tax=Phenylobacterium sp. TaxID=1871053 RepID=UPI002F9380B5